MKLFDKILIANRGEIAVRIISSAKKLGIHTVAIYSDADESALHTRMADMAYHIGSDNLSESYLNINKIIQIAKASNCQAIHPGYGFLSENPAFAEACEKSGIVFIGPKSSVVKSIGNKIAARAIAKKCGAAITEGLTGTPEEIVSQKGKLLYPLLIKAAAGGGGKGMRIVRKQEELFQAIETASREALSYFGDSAVYVERYIENPRHIEVQVLGDNFGNMIHLFERECSIQRRYQKIIEESPSITLTPEIRDMMCKTAVLIAKSIEYSNAGTIEFLVDQEMNFYFLEMNTRIQVEHPVTEMVTGVDVVEEQIRIASGFPMRYKQDDIAQNGHAIECRIYAENPANGFMPSPGEISLYRQPSGEHVRLDASIDKKSTIHRFFDPMISKLICWGINREEARRKSIEMLEQYIIHGIETNIPYLIEVLQSEEFFSNEIYTTYCDDATQKIVSKIDRKKKITSKSFPLIAFLLYNLNEHKISGLHLNLWQSIGYWRNIMQLNFKLDQEEYLLEILSVKDKTLNVRFQQQLINAIIIDLSDGFIQFSINNAPYQAYVSNCAKNKSEITINGLKYSILRSDILCEEIEFEPQERNTSTDSNTILSPMFGNVIKVNVKEGDEVKKGNILAVIEAMKMENNIVANRDSKIEKVNIKFGQTVESGKVLFVIENV
jgi:3-methylcrotonyl-CoA carboxylase alpha subunit